MVHEKCSKCKVEKCEAFKLSIDEMLKIRLRFLTEKTKNGKAIVLFNFHAKKTNGLTFDYKMIISGVVNDSCCNLCCSWILKCKKTTILKCLTYKTQEGVGSGNHNNHK